MQIEAIDPIRATDDDGKLISMEPGDRLTVGENFGNLACRMGWAKDVAGQVATGERRTGTVEVSPQNVISDQASR